MNIKKLLYILPLTGAIFLSSCNESRVSSNNSSSSIVSSAISSRVVSSNSISSSQKDISIDPSYKLPYHQSIKDDEELIYTTFPAMSGEGNVLFPLIYSDNYFNVSSFTPSKRLAQVSIGMALASFNSKEEDDNLKPVNIKDFFNELNLEDVQINNDYCIKPNKDTIGLAIGHKYLKESDSYLVTLAIRSGFYRGEWASNFFLGEEGEHAGFSQARDKAYSFLKDYVTSLNTDKKIKLWVAGYSRGGATTNLLGRYLDDAIDSGTVGINLAKEDLFAYSFEAPLCGIEDYKKDYKNIFVYSNPNDFVTSVPPANYGFLNYGTIIDTSAYYKNKRETLANTIYQINPNFAFKEYTPVGQFDTGYKLFKTLFDVITKQAKSSDNVSLQNRAEYISSGLQSSLMDITAFVLASDNFKKIEDYINNDFYAFIQALGKIGGVLLSYDTKENKIAQLCAILDETFTDMGLEFDQTRLQEIVSNGWDVIVFIFNGIYQTENMLEALLTNFSYISFSHSGETNLAIMLLE